MSGAISFENFSSFSRETDLRSLLGFISARRGRVYLPQDELALAGLSDEDIFAGRVTDKWRSFMRSQIKRARLFFDQAEKGVTQLSEASRWPVRLSLSNTSLSLPLFLKGNSCSFRCGHRCCFIGRSWTRSRRTITTTSPSELTSARRRSFWLSPSHMGGPSSARPELLSPPISRRASSGDFNP